MSNCAICSKGVLRVVNNRKLARASGVGSDEDGEAARTRAEQGTWKESGNYTSHLSIIASTALFLFESHCDIVDTGSRALDAAGGMRGVRLWILPNIAEAAAR